MLAIAEFDPSIKKVKSTQEFVLIVRTKPLRKKILNRVGRKFNFNNEQYALLTGVNVRTYQRQKPESSISVVASENTMRLAEVYKTGMLTFENDEESFRTWLNTNIPALGNQKPIDLVTSGLGAQTVNEELLRMEYSLT